MPLVAGRAVRGDAGIANITAIATAHRVVHMTRGILRRLASLAIFEDDRFVSGNHGFYRERLRPVVIGRSFVHAGFQQVIRHFPQSVHPGRQDVQNLRLTVWIPATQNPAVVYNLGHCSRSRQVCVGGRGIHQLCALRLSVDLQFHSFHLSAPLLVVTLL